MFVKTYAYFFPMFYVILFIAGNLLVRITKYSRIKDRVKSNAALFVILALTVIFGSFSFRELIGDEYLLDISIALCFSLSLNVYLRLLTIVERNTVVPVANPVGKAK
ncbi:hypothetical protein [Mucilaginibacter gynuensis]